ncbi:MAG: hypothetical protein NT112_00290 [Methanoregula sp.]|nr:hypothetical protein [Methanoregula sp.]
MFYSRRRNGSKTFSKRDNALLKNSLFVIKRNDTHHIISENYYCKTEPCYTILQHELEGKKVEPTSSAVLDAYVIPICLSRAASAGIPICEWVYSFGMIVRFSHKCLEIKALDEHECMRSDMAVCAFVRALLRCRQLPVTADHEHLISLLDHAIKKGTEGLHSDPEQMYACAWEHATGDERVYLP